ncbi:MAG: cytochrome c biogenesis protein CcdA [Candidatus Omnitrophota bacterium]
MMEWLISYTEVNLKEISLLSYLLVFLGGVLSSFTPCVYPLIPITASYIGAASAGSKRRGFILSFFYVLGIAVIYSCLGAFAALGGRLFGEISANPWTHLIVGIIFLALGLSMLDIFTLPIPAFLKSSGSLSKRKGAFGAFLVGLSAGLIVGPCTAPALGAVLVFVGSKQNILLGMTLLFTFAFGMGLLLMVIGTFAGLASSLPKSGKWLNAIKKAFGVVLIAGALYFIITAIRRF